MANNYTLGRGAVWFSRFITGTQTPEGYRYIGNTPEFNLTIEQETLDHFSSDAGIREKDESVPLEVNRTGSMTCDNIDKDNVALFFFGTAATLAIASSIGVTDNSLVVKKGLTYQIGRTAAKPDGARGIENVVVRDVTDVTTYVLNTDYSLDPARGLITIIAAGAIADDDNIHITYDQDQITMDQVISGSEPVEGSLMLIEANPVGEDHDVYIPWVKISPNGDMAFKGDDWRVIPFSLEVLKPSLSEAIYRDGQPVAV